MNVFCTYLALITSLIHADAQWINLPTICQGMPNILDIGCISFFRDIKVAILILLGHSCWRIYRPTNWNETQCRTFQKTILLQSGKCRMYNKLSEINTSIFPTLCFFVIYNEKYNLINCFMDLSMIWINLNYGVQLQDSGPGIMRI